VAGRCIGVAVLWRWFRCWRCRARGRDDDNQHAVPPFLGGYRPGCYEFVERPVLRRRPGTYGGYQLGR
jgi:hypothetical protein